MLFFRKKVVEEDDFDKFERLIKSIEKAKHKIHLARLKLIESVRIKNEQRKFTIRK